MQTEYSIQSAMVEAIRSAEHYVYIENQFFVSVVKTDTLFPSIDIKNDISTALYNRIVKAHSEGKTFRWDRLNLAEMSKMLSFGFVIHLPSGFRLGASELMS